MFEVGPVAAFGAPLPDDLGRPAGRHHAVGHVVDDQGAGGPANVLKELVEKSGGWVEIRNIRVGDPTMSVLEIYVAEYQERNGFLIRSENIAGFQAICER